MPRRLRIGHPMPGQLILPADYGSFSLSGQIAALSYTPVGGGAGDDYDWMDSPVGYTDHWVDPEKTTNGDGSSGNPYQWSQMMSFNPGGGRHRFIVMPGQLSVTGNIPDDTKMPYLDPVFSGTAANPVLVKAQYPATRSTTTTEQLTIIRRTANIGSILGTQGRDYWRFDGFKMEGGCGSQGADGGNEKANIVIRGATGWWITRFWIDGEEADHSNQASTNGGAMFCQVVNDLVVRDVIIENIGDHTSADQYWQGIELYDTWDSDFSYFTIRNCYGMGFFMKGEYDFPFQRNHIHHGFAEDCAEACYMAMYINAGTNTADHNYWYNLVADQRGTPGFNKCFLLNGIVPHTGTHVQNCTFIGGRESFSAVAGPTYTNHISFQNNVFYLSGSNIVFQDGSWGANTSPIVFDWNQYNGHTVSFAETTSTLSNLEQWQGSPYNKDTNGSSAAPSFVDFANGDFRTNGSAVAPDHWNLFDVGGSNVPRGAFQAYGCRTDV